MASFFILTLDTLAPAGLSISLDDGALYTNSTSVQLKVTISDENTSGYQMKIWGVNGAAEEGNASWETFTTTKTITLPTGEGQKTINVKVRDDVGNETSAATASIILKTTLPVVTVTGPDKARISKVSGFDTSIINFTSSDVFAEYKVCVVSSSSAEADDGVVIPTAGGSNNTSGSAGDYPASTPIKVTIKGADLETASGGDGAKVVKVFVKDKAGQWSVT